MLYKEQTGVMEQTEDTSVLILILMEYTLRDMNRADTKGEWRKS